MSEETEADLIAGLQHRDAQAFTRFFEGYADRVYRVAVHLVGNEEDADEVVQATFLSAFAAIERFEPRAQLSTWLYRIAFNHSMMLLRRQHPTEPLPDDDETLPLPTEGADWSSLPEAQVLGGEAKEILLSAIGELPDPLRAAFVLRDIEQMSTAECAQVQGISEAACKVRLHRARLRLRERLSDYFDEWHGHGHKEPS